MLDQEIHSVNFENYTGVNNPKLLPVALVAQTLGKPDWNSSVTGNTGRDPVNTGNTQSFGCLTWVSSSFRFWSLPQGADGVLSLLPSPPPHLRAWALPRPQVEPRLLSNKLWVTADFWEGVWGQLGIPFPEQVLLATNIHCSRILQPTEGSI